MPLGTSGKYFIIRSRLNGMALDVAEGNTNPGAKVITWPEHKAINQQWFHEPLTNTIRSRLNEFCMQIVDERIVLNPYDRDAQGQKFVLQEECISSLQHDKVLDIVEGNTSEGAELCLWEQHGGDNQKWEFEYLEPQYFRLVSLMHEKCFDMEMGTKVIVTFEKNVDHQIWYEDTNSRIRNKETDQVLDVEDGFIVLKEYDSDRIEEQGWAMTGNQILNRSDQSICIGIHEKNSDDGARLVSEAYLGEAHQHWTTVPV